MPVTVPGAIIRCLVDDNREGGGERHHCGENQQGRLPEHSRQWDEMEPHAGADPERNQLRPNSIRQHYLENHY